jgi:hypothetical protein
MELQVSRLAAAAAQKVLQNSKAMAAQQQAQQAQQDPIVQMQQQELQIKQQGVQISQQDQALKAQKAAADQAAKTEQLQIERDRIASQERIAGLQLGAKVGAEKAKLKAAHELEGTRMGIDMGRELFNRNNPNKENNPKGK